ncbi:hypothetical protein BDY21DRAFT_366623 [Lineolata rhizophorae]|uniref:DUF788 domain protein n=1 Tax=Lineolata rhizophorae TaxID=578093 RepID=A0A6A6NQ87_9PEZI|nr:hypothetical protein BDY21DRAFT_366623 [Lineolata rhizophorae]
MAQKAAKSLAARNTATLNRTHLITLAVHTFFLLLRALLFRSSFSRTSLLLYLGLSSPALATEFWFERIARPVRDSTRGGELVQPGEDLEAKGLTEWMWDVIYWTYGCVVVSALFGDYGWWLWGIVPLYSIWLAYTTFVSARSGMAGMMGGGDDAAAQAGGASKRQQKMERRGGQKMQYR